MKGLTKPQSNSTTPPTLKPQGSRRTARDPGPRSRVLRSDDLGLGQVTRGHCSTAGWVELGSTRFQHLMSTSADTEREHAVSRIYRATEPPNRQYRHHEAEGEGECGTHASTEAPSAAFGVRYTLASMRKRLKCGRSKSPAATLVTHPCYPNF